MARNGRVAARTIVGIAALLTLSRSELASQGSARSAPSPPATTFHYEAEFRTPPAIEALQRHLAPGDDAFPEEKIAEALAVHWRTLSAALRERPAGARCRSAERCWRRSSRAGRSRMPNCQPGRSRARIARARASPGATLDRVSSRKSWRR